MKKLVLFLCLIIIVLGKTATLKLDRGNTQATEAFNAALLEIWQDGTYNDIYRTWYNETPERFSDCVEDSGAIGYPVTMTNKGLLDEILDTSEIKMGYFVPLAILPGFEQLANGDIVGGFYPSLAEELVSRIANNYQIFPINITWIPITTVAGFYPDHVSGVYDIIFMSLFKTAMWSAPVAPRPDIWTFSCGLLTTEPIRYYVCPSAVIKNLDLTSAATIDGFGVNVEFIGGGAQQTVAESKFPQSNRIIVADLQSLFYDCANNITDVIIELPARITNSLDGIVVDSQPIATYQNTGAAFRLDK